MDLKAALHTIPSDITMSKIQSQKGPLSEKGRSPSFPQVHLILSYVHYSERRELITRNVLDSHFH